MHCRLALTAGQQPHKLHMKAELRHYGAWQVCRHLWHLWTGGLCRLTICLSSVCSQLKVLALASLKLINRAMLQLLVRCTALLLQSWLVLPIGGSLRAAQGACWHKAVSMLVSCAFTNRHSLRGSCALRVDPGGQPALLTPTSVLQCRERKSSSWRMPAAALVVSLSLTALSMTSCPENVWASWAQMVLGEFVYTTFI